MDPTPTIDAEPADSLSRLPDELLQTICFYLPPQDAVSLSIANSRLLKLVDQPLLWRYYCDTHFDCWHLVGAPASIRQHLATAPWKSHFLARITREKRNKRLFESLLRTQHERYSKMQQIAEYSYEAKEMLQREAFGARPDSEDFLARRYFAEATLSLIHRTKALEIWSSLGTSVEADLEQQIAAFDLFIIGYGWGDIRDISRALDQICDDILADQPEVLGTDLEQRALIVMHWLQRHHLLGLAPDASYYSMKHNFLSYSLRQRCQASLPLQSAVMYCAVARRLGVDATPINYPTHIFVIVELPNPQPSSAGLSAGIGSMSNNRMYLDPWSTHNGTGLGEVISLEALSARLTVGGIPPSAHSLYLDPASASALVGRTCRNLMRSYEEWNRGPARDDLIGNHHGFYAYLWAMTLVEEIDPQEIERGPLRRAHLGHLPAFFRDHFPEDLVLVQRHLGPLFERHPRGRQFLHILAEMKSEDLNRKPLIKRDRHASGVKYKVGVMFQHKRYGYVGVIKGWDSACKADERWISQMRVDDLDMGRGQAFYHVMGEDRSTRYVAEENIEPLYAEPSEKFQAMAGRYFKRWDADKRVFISNIRDEYPDD